MQSLTSGQLNTNAFLLRKRFVLEVLTNGDTNKYPLVFVTYIQIFYKIVFFIIFLKLKKPEKERASIRSFDIAIMACCR